MGYVHVCRSSSDQAGIPVAPTTIFLEDDDEEEMVDAGNAEAVDMAARVLEPGCSTMPRGVDEYQRQAYCRTKRLQAHRA